MIVLPHNQPIHRAAWIHTSILPAVARQEWAVGQVIKKETQRDSHHERWSKPTIKDKRQKVESNCCCNDREEDCPFKTPLHQLPTLPKFALKEEKLVIKKSWSNQPKRAESTNNVVGIIFGIIHIGMMLQVHPCEDRETESQKQS
jgi:hypothetical protein